MAKAVLVMEMPESCRQCYVRQIIDYSSFEGDMICAIKGKSVYENYINSSKPDWCPLQKFPEKKEVKTFPSAYVNWHENAYNSGWNACIEAILDEKPEGV